jgi:hypothetical protein
VQKGSIFVMVLGITAILALATILVVGFGRANRAKVLAGQQATGKAAIQFAKMFKPPTTSACIELSTGRNNGESDRDYHARVMEVAFLLQQDGCTNVVVHIPESADVEQPITITAKREVFIQDQ